MRRTYRRKNSRQQQNSEPQIKTVLTPPVQQYSTIQQSPTLLSQIPKVQIAQPFDKNMETVLRQQKKILHLNRFLTFLMVIIAVGIGYLAIAQFRQTHSSETLDSSNRVLAVNIDSDLESSDISDEEQIKNALKNGGLMRINPDNISKNLKYKLDRYAAGDSTNHYWVLGAFLNYIASEGWELVQAPSSGLSQMFYFRKK